MRMALKLYPKFYSLMLRRVRVLLCSVVARLFPSFITRKYRPLDALCNALTYCVILLIYIKLCYHILPLPMPLAAYAHATQNECHQMYYFNSFFAR